MSCSTIRPNFKPISSLDSSHTLSLPTIFTTSSKAPYPSLPIPTRPVKLQLLLSLKHKTHLSSIIYCDTQTSDWAQEDKEENNSPTTATIDETELEDDVEEEEEEEEASEFVEPPEDAKLFVGNLPYDVDSQSLATLFEQAGTVEVSEVIYNRDTEQSRGFGFVTMSSVDEAEKAVDKFNQYELNGRLLTVNKAAPRGTEPERPARTYQPSYRIYVGNIPWDVDDSRLEQVFSEHGKVVQARVVYDRESGRSRGFGFVTMSNETELNDAIAALDGQSMDGRAIRVNVADQRPRRTF